VLSGLGILSTALGGRVGRPPGPLGLSLNDRCFHGLDDPVVRLACLKEELEENRPLELLQRIRDLVTRAARGVPFGDDAARVRNADAEIRRSYLAFPDDIALFHVIYVT